MKRMNRPAMVIGPVALALAVAQLAHGASAAAEYDRLFGADEKRVLATPDTKDDAALASKIMDAATKAKDDHDFQSFLYRRSFDLAVKDVRGLPVAEQAIDLLDPLDASGAAELRKRYLDSLKVLYQKAPRADKEGVAKVYIQRLLDEADALTHARKFPQAKALYQQAQSVDSSARTNRRGDIQAHLKTLEAHVEMEHKFDALVAKLAKSPQEKTLARDLALMCASERDDLPEAARYAEQSGDDALKRDVALAQTDLKSLSDDDCLTLADWYKTLPEHGGPSRGAMLQKAITLYGRFLDAHQKEDAQRLSAIAARDAAQSELDHEAVATGQTINLLALIDLGRDGKSGSYHREGTALSGNGTLTVPLLINGSYRLQIRFVRVSGDDILEFSAPAGDREFAYWLLNERQKLSGIVGIDGTDLAHGPSTIKGGAVSNGQPHTMVFLVNVQGDSVRFTASLDDQPLSNWTGAISRLRKPYLGKPKQIAFTCVASEKLVIQEMTLQMLSGTAEPESAASK